MEVMMGGNMLRPNAGINAAPQLRVQFLTYPANRVSAEEKSAQVQAEFVAKAAVVFEQVRVIWAASSDRKAIGQGQMDANIQFWAFAEDIERVLAGGKVGHDAGRADVSAPVQIERGEIDAFRQSAIIGGNEQSRHVDQPSLSCQVAAKSSRTARCRAVR